MSAVSYAYGDLAVIERVDDLYYKVKLDFTKGSHLEVGAAYAKTILEACPDYEAVIDNMLDLSVKGGKIVSSLETLIADAKNLLVDMPAAYVEEIVGMATVFNSDVDKLGDGKLSKNELLLFQVFHDVLDPACSAAAVYGESSDTGETLVGRNLDWYDLPGLGNLHAVTLFENGQEANSVIGLGFLGELLMPSAVSDAHVSAAVLDSDMDVSYFSSLGRDAYLADMRQALETQDDLDAVSDFLLARENTHSFLVMLADRERAAVLEDDQAHPTRAGLREADSILRAGTQWGFADSVAAVNSNLLPGTTDNHTGAASNERRFASYRWLFAGALGLDGSMSMEDLQTIMAYPGTDGVARSSGAIYRARSDYPTVQSYVLNMTTLEMTANFGPTDGNPPHPDYLTIFSGNPFTNFFD